MPCASFRALLELAPAPDGRRRFLSTAKGIEPETGQRMSEIILEYQPGSSVAALSGPTFADEVARGDPSAAVVAGGAFAAEIQAAFSSVHLRLYRSEDLAGVEYAGALKNVVAIAAGIVAGLDYGHNTLAALVTRGLAEIARIVRARGGEEKTVHGLAGIGDLMLTCTGRQSRNRRVGEEIGRGRALSEVLLEMPEVAEGARTCLAVPTLAARCGVEAPIAEAVVGCSLRGGRSSRGDRPSNDSQPARPSREPLRGDGVAPLVAHAQGVRSMSSRATASPGSICVPRQTAFDRQTARRRSRRQDADGLDPQAPSRVRIERVELPGDPGAGQ